MKRHSPPVTQPQVDRAGHSRRRAPSISPSHASRHSYPRTPLPGRSVGAFDRLATPLLGPVALQL